MTYSAFRTGAIVLAVFVGFYLPSSIGGAISRELTAVSLAVTCGLLGLLALGRRGLGSPGLVFNSVAMLTWLALCSALSPFREYSPGVVFIYVAIALLYALNLKDLAPAGGLRIVFAIVSLASVVLGVLIVLDVKTIDELLNTHYAAFWPGLLHSMLDLSNRPVLTFATHSMAGFMIYLLFFMALRTYTVRGGLGWLALACAETVLLVLLKSTSGLIFGIIALLQLSQLVLRRSAWAAVPVGIVFTAAALAFWVWSGVTLAAVIEGARSAVLGDQVRGLASRYGEGGLLAGNLAYLLDNPTRPIGFAFSPSLYLGDSGLIVNQLRGSFVLLAMVYGGLLVFLRSNLRSPAGAVWLWVMVVLFEVGFTPLQYFRFVAFVPFMIVYLNGLETPTADPKV